MSDRIEPDHSSEMRREVTARLRKALDDNRGPLDESERQLRQALTDIVDKAAADARADPEFWQDLEDLDPALVPAADSPPADPLSLPWFYMDEREILARLAGLDVQ